MLVMKISIKPKKKNVEVKELAGEPIYENYCKGINLNTIAKAQPEREG